MALQQVVGTNLAVSASKPATNDATGYEALTFLTVGKLESIPPTAGTRDVDVYQELETDTELKFAAAYKAGAAGFVVALDPSDAGQAVLETAANSTGLASKVAIRYTLPDGTVYYRQAIVARYGADEMSVGNVIKASVFFDFYNSTIRV